MFVFLLNIVQNHPKILKPLLLLLGYSGFILYRVNYNDKERYYA
jgi:hypothetical protein